MMGYIIDFFCEESFKKTILTLIDNLRFESLMGIIQDFYDENLKILEYYNLPKSPNLQHYFIAHMITKGKQVITTNYDSLIEHALINLGVRKDQIIPIIAEKDYLTFNNPYLLNRNGKYPLIKIHGSIENICSGDMTMDSIVATIKSLGENKQGIEIFKIEDYKYPIFKKVLNGKTLIVMGYSGMDDFDIIPSLFTIKKYNKIIWIFHTEEIGNAQNKIYEITENSYAQNEEQVVKLLRRFKNNGLSNKIFLIKCNTSKLIQELIKINPMIEDQNFNLNPLTWFTVNLKPIGQLKKLYLPQKILLDRYEKKKSLKIAKMILRKANKTISASKDFWIWVAQRNMGLIYHRKNRFKKAIKHHEISLEISKKMNDKLSMAGSYANLGDVYLEFGEWKKTLEYYGKADVIYQKHDDKNALIHLYHNAGMFFEERGRKYYKTAKRFYIRSKELVSDSSDILKKAKVYGSYANILYHMRDINKAIKYYNKALQIAENFKLLHYIGIYLGSLGMVQLKKERYDDALKKFQAAISIHKSEGDKKLLALIYFNVAGVYWESTDYSLAYKYSKKSYSLFKRIGMKRNPVAVRVKKFRKKAKRKMDFII